MNTTKKTDMNYDIIKSSHNIRILPGSEPTREPLAHLALEHGTKTWPTLQPELSQSAIWCQICEMTGRQTALVFVISQDGDVDLQCGASCKRHFVPSAISHLGLM